MERAAIAGGDGAHQGAARRGDRRRRLRFFQHASLNQHLGFQGRPLACRNASRWELKAYANALRERGKGAIEIALTRQIAVLEDDGLELLDLLLGESARPVTFIAMFDRDDLPEAVRETLRKDGTADRARRAAADLAAAAHARGQHAQSLLVRRLPFVAARVRGQVQGGAGGGLPRSRVPQPVPRGAQAPRGLRQLGTHHGARGEVRIAEEAGRANGRRDRGRAGQGRRRRIPRYHAR